MNVLYLLAVPLWLLMGAATYRLAPAIMEPEFVRNLREHREADEGFLACCFVAWPAVLLRWVALQVHDLLDMAVKFLVPLLPDIDMSSNREGEKK